MRGLFLAAAAAAALTAACGDRLVYRPLTVDVQNVSATAESLVLKVFAGEDADRACSTINLANVQSFDTPYESRWTRADGADRQLDVPEIDSDRALVVVYTEDANGLAIQLACSAIEYSELESGLITLRLSTRMARIISPWLMCSARSSSIGSSGEVEWRRCSSPAGWIAATKSWSSNASAPTSRTTRST